MTETPSDPQYAEAWLTGTPPDQTTGFYIPRGNTGPMGPRGPIGPTPLVGTVVTNMGPAAEGTLGPQGLKGDKGDPGGWVDSTTFGAGTSLDDVATPGTYFISSANGGMSPANAAGWAEVLHLSGYLIQRVRLHTNPRVVYERTRSSTLVWSPWFTYNATRVDQTAGRAIYHWDDINKRDQLIYGDTGWRKVILPGEIANHPNLNGFIRRVDNEVEFTIYETTSGALASGNQNIYVVPTGFKFVLGESPAMLSGMVIDSSASPVANSVMYIASAGTNTVVLKAIVNVRHYSSLRWKTQEPWPTTLPGTAHGSIPNL